jgi:hypothetical protein
MQQTLFSPGNAPQSVAIPFRSCLTISLLHEEVYVTQVVVAVG